MLRFLIQFSTVIFIAGLGAGLFGVPACNDASDPAIEDAPEGDRVKGWTDEKHPVLLIGADALDLDILKPLVEQGRLPTFARLMREGAWGVLQSEREMRSPALWTTIATGRPRSVHRIYDFVTGSRYWPGERRNEDRRLVTSRMREVPAVWNLASDAGREVAVVGWLNTWPAEKVRGTMVAPYVALGDAKQVTIKGAVYPDEVRQVYPPEDWQKIKHLIVTPDEVPTSLVESFAAPPGPELLQAYPILERYQRALRWSLANMLSMRDITLHLLRTERPDLAMVYFEAADSLAHRFWLFREPLSEVTQQLTEAGLPTERAEALTAHYAKVLDRTYELLDEIAGQLIQALPDGARVVVVSDHGFGPWSGRYDLNPAVPFTGEHQLAGTIMVAGHGVRPGAKIEKATQYDVTPTLLRLLGIAADEPFEGESLADRIFQADALPTELDRPDAAEPDNERAQEARDAPFSTEEVERLRSLGYVQ